MKEQAKSKPVDLLLIKCSSFEHAQEQSSSRPATLQGLKVRLDNINSPLNKYGAARLAAFEREYELLSEKFRRSEETRKNLWDKLFEGALHESCIFLLDPSNDNRQKYEQAKAGYWEKKNETREKKRKEEREYPGRERFCGDWLRPMPIWSEGEPMGYCQATGKSKRRIRKFLNDIKAAKPRLKLKQGQGRPLNLYPVGVGLRVLDNWLSEWLPLNPFGTFFLLQTLLRVEPLTNEGNTTATCAQAGRFIEIIKKHRKRCEKLPASATE